MKLTKCEKKVVDRLLQGKTNAIIATELDLSVKTVKFHLTKVYKKANVKSRTQLMLKYIGEEI